MEREGENVTVTFTTNNYTDAGGLFLAHRRLDQCSNISAMFRDPNAIIDLQAGTATYQEEEGKVSNVRFYISIDGENIEASTTYCSSNFE